MTEQFTRGVQIPAKGNECSCVSVSAKVKWRK